MTSIQTNSISVPVRAMNLLATLNTLRAAAGKAPLKVWKESRKKLEAAITKAHGDVPVGSTVIPDVPVGKVFEALGDAKTKVTVTQADNADGLDIPHYLKRNAGDKGSWGNVPLKASASSVTLKSVAISKPLTPEQTKIAAANKAQGKRKPKGERARYDWDAATEAAAQGKLPTPPDFTANTHKYYRPKLAEVVKMAKASDVRGLRAFKINGSSTSPTAIKKYVACALKALAAKAKG